ELKNQQQQLKPQTEKQEQPQIINNLDFFDSNVQNELYHKLSKSIDDKLTQFFEKELEKLEQEQEQEHYQFDWSSNYDND
ncbi:hypothetical protein KEC49_02705, partial ['Elaeagnus angustifolia' witches'-broom phytoplasma]|nr:hypothetical protein ['Elaeagnus angustifolia' witches'-broom phytoplasma]